MRTPANIERQHYEARRKGWLDCAAGMAAARLEEREKVQADARNVLVRWIHRLQKQLKQPGSPAEELAPLPLEELGRRAEMLESEVRNNPNARYTPTATTERDPGEDKRLWRLGYDRGLELARLRGHAAASPDWFAHGYADGFVELRMDGTAGAWTTWVELIHYCERFLGRSETPAEQLATLSLGDLHWLAKELLGQFLQQRERERRN